MAARKKRRGTGKELQMKEHMAVNYTEFRRS
jgi:hypothetical protein